MTPGAESRLRIQWWQVALSAPVVFALHLAEESPGFVTWLNGILREDPITDAMFRQVNATAFMVTLLLAVLAGVTRAEGAGWALLGWLSMLMLANGVFHILASLMSGRYAPGVVTSILLYLPIYAWYVTGFVRAFRPRPPVVAAVAVLGALPMLGHGSWILFFGRRLF